MNNPILNNKFEKITFIYDLLGPLKSMYWISVLLVVFAAAWEGMILASFATFLQSIVDTTKYASNTFDSNSLLSQFYGYYQRIPEDYRVFVGFIMTATTVLIASLINIGIATYQANFSTKFVVNARCLIFNNLCKSSLSFYDNHKQGELMTMVINEAWACYRVLKNALSLVINILKGTVYLFCMIAISLQLTIITILFTLIYLFETVFISQKLRKLANTTAEKRRSLSVIVSESIQGIKHIKLYNLYNKQESSFRNNTRIYDTTVKRQGIIMQWQAIVSQILVLITIVCLIFINIKFSFTAISLMITYLYVMQKLNTVVHEIYQSFNRLSQSLPEFERIKKFLNNDKIYLEKGGSYIKKVLLKEKISYKNVFLRYDNENVLNNINLDIVIGNTIALVGESGSGKTSLANLIVRLYDPSQGAILIDDVNIQEFDLNFLREKIGLVNQDTILFNKTIRENIIIGKVNASEEEIINAAKKAYVHEFVSQMSNGYDTLVGDRGVKLSGGQKQRINLAQIFLKKPEIMILDEATSALDSKSEQYIQNSIVEISRRCTNIIIAHRLSTIRHADKVIVLDKGRIIEKGDWESLMKTKGVFHDMVNRQLFVEQST